VECRRDGTSVRGRVDQGSDDVDELEDRARPAMREQEWHGLRIGRTHVQEVHAHTVDGHPELTRVLEVRLRTTPVVGLGPVGAQGP